VVDLLKITGQVDFDPRNKGVYDATKKNWVENYYLDPEQMNKVKQQLEQYDVGTRKKKEERKSQKRDVKSPRRVPNLTDKEDSPRVGSGNLAVEDLIASFHRELRYQREMLENIKSTVTTLRAQIYEEAEQTHHLATKLQSEITSIRNDASDDQQDQQNIQHTLEQLQNFSQHYISNTLSVQYMSSSKPDKMMQSAPGSNTKKKTCQRTREKVELVYNLCTN